jgi:indole-3-glycerol phosphate synthase
MLEPAQLADLVAESGEIGLDVLLEVHDEREVEMALQVSVELVGINNRALRTFLTDLAVTERLAPRIPGERLVVAESGIAGRADILRLHAAGARAFLIGESLMRAADIGVKLDELLTD